MTAPSLALIRRRTAGSVHGRLTPSHVEITWTLPDPIVVTDQRSVAFIAEILTPEHDDVELALFLRGPHATGCLSALEAPRPREIEQLDVDYANDGTAFTALFPRRWVRTLHHDAAIAGSVSIDGASPVRFAGLLESLRASA